MKKIIVTVVAIGAATISAYAQSPGVECRMMADCLGTSPKTRKMVTYAKKTDTVNTTSTVKTTQTWLERALKEAVVKANVSANWAGKYGQQTAATPAQKNTTAKSANTKRQVAQAKPAEKGGSFFGAFFGGKYPGESDKDYKWRMQMSAYPACQPFK